jgi:hypothetical protein
MANRVIVKVTLRTKGPLSLKMPVAEGARENEFDNFPVMTRGVDAEGAKQRTGYLPATTIRGFLRRAVTLKRMRDAAAQGKPYKLPQIYNEMIGQDAESEKKAEEIDLIAIQKARESSPVVDLFGSGLNVKSRLLVSHFCPALNILPEAFTGVRKDIDDTEDALELMDPKEMEGFVRRTERNRERAAEAAVVKQLEGKIRRDERKNGASEDDKKALEVARSKETAAEGGMGEMKVSTRQLTTYYALPAEIELHGRLVIERAKPRDLELLEYALSELSLAPVLGAQSARGCGEIAGTFEFTNEEGKLIKNVVVGGYSAANITNF